MKKSSKKAEPESLIFDEPRLDELVQYIKDIADLVLEKAEQNCKRKRRQARQRRLAAAR